MASAEKLSQEKNASIFKSAVLDANKKLSNSLIPSIKGHIQNEKFDAKKDSLDFLDAKNSILLSYMIDLTQLLRLKSSESNENKTQIEECLGRLREMKIILERVRPLEKKMRYQLDKLLSMAASSSTFSAAADSNLSTGNDNPVSSDPLAFRPNPKSMLGKDDDGQDNNSSSDDQMLSNSEDGSSDEEEDEELMAARKAISNGRSKKKNSNVDGSNVESAGLYRAPRLAAVPFAEKEKQAEKEERMLKKQRDRMRKSEVLSTLKAAYGDTPEEEDFTGGAALGKQREASRRFNEKMEEKMRYEEDAMVRLTVSRKDKKMRNKILREEHSNLNSIADLGDLSAGVTAAFGGEKRGKSSRGSFQEEEMSSGRHINGKRRREEGNNGEQKHANPKNSFQKALYGMGGNGKKKKGR